jgi:hypothetical protein
MNKIIFGNGFSGGHAPFEEHSKGAGKGHGKGYGYGYGSGYGFPGGFPFGDGAGYLGRGDGVGYRINNHSPSWDIK